jgi:hypothetical protein
MPETAVRPQKITFADMRAAGVRGILVYCTSRGLAGDDGF